MRKVSVLFYFFFALCFSSEAQITPELESVIQDYIHRNSTQLERSDPNFQKAWKHFKNESADSTILNSYKYLQSKKKSASLVELVKYFRGWGLHKKGLYADAQSVLKSIDKEFELYPLAVYQRANNAMVHCGSDSALDLFLELEKVEDPTEYALQSSTILHNIGVCYMYLEDFDSSEKYLLEGLRKQLEEGDTTLIVTSYMDLANLYYTQFLDDQAIPNFERAYQLSLEIENYELRRMTALNMSVVDENRGDLEKALKYRKEYDQWSDSVNKHREVWRLAEQEKKEIAKNKQQEIERLALANRIQKAESNLLWIGISLLLVILLLVVVLYRQKVKSNKLIEAQKESLNRMNDFKNKLFSIISHDLRSSVHAIRIGADQLADASDQTTTELIQKQKALSNSTYGLVDNLLNWAQIQSDQFYFAPEEFQLRRVSDQVVFNYRPVLEQKSIELKNNVEASIRIWGDVDAFKIVLRNLLDNAIKYSNKNTTITLIAEVVNDKVKFSIIDEGNGIPEDKLSTLLVNSAKVAKQSSNETEGSGLGMQLCQSFMKMNHGKIEIVSQVGVGTQVSLYFPMKPLEYA